MKGFRKLALLGWFMVWIGGIQVGMAQWVSHGPPGGDVRAVTINPQNTSILFVGSSEGGVYKSEGWVYKSIDGGANWNQMNIGVESSTVNALAVDPLTTTTVYAGTGGGVYKSSNSGDSWKLINSGLNNSTLSLAIDPQNPATIYAGTINAGVYKSTDGGENWTPINNGLTTGGYVTTLAIDPKASSTIYAGAVPAEISSPDGGPPLRIGGGAYKSTDRGELDPHYKRPAGIRRRPNHRS